MCEGAIQPFVRGGVRDRRPRGLEQDSPERRLGTFGERNGCAHGLFEYGKRGNLLVGEGGVAGYRHSCAFHPLTGWLLAMRPTGAVTLGHEDSLSVGSRTIKGSSEGVQQVYWACGDRADRPRVRLQQPVCELLVDRPARRRTGRAGSSSPDSRCSARPCPRTPRPLAGKRI